MKFVSLFEMQGTLLALDNKGRVWSGVWKTDKDSPLVGFRLVTEAFEPTDSGALVSTGSVYSK